MINNSKNIALSIMSISDLENIKDILISDFDDYWNYNTLKEELTSENSIYIVAKWLPNLSNSRATNEFSKSTIKNKEASDVFRPDVSIVDVSKPKIIGFAGIKLILDEAELMNIVVKKSYRNLGVGTLLLQELLNICKNKSITSIFLEVNEKNLNAQKLYNNFGF